MRKQLNLVRQGGRVQRYHSKPLLMQENVAEHSFTVAWVAWVYCAQFNELPSAHLLMACLQHDLAEAVVGDIPSPTKKMIGGEALAALESQVLEDHEMPEYEPYLEPKERELLKWADNLSGYMKCLQEVHMGNRHLHSTLENYRRYLAAMITNAVHLEADTLRKMITATEGEHDVYAYS